MPIFLSLAAFFLGFAHTTTAFAANLANFRPGNIIDDATMSNNNAMSESAIQSFLKSKNSCNNTNISLASRYSSYTYHIVNGHFVCMADENFNGESAAHIIWQAAQDYRINPQVIIVLLQKEQGLITDTWPNSRQYRTATGYGCPDTAACDTKYYGLKNQIRNAAAMFRTVLDGGWSNYPAGKTTYIQFNPNKSCGGTNVYVENRATSALYRYTPYQPNASALAAGYGSGDSCGAYGNRNFYLYLHDWFGGGTRSGGSNSSPAITVNPVTPAPTPQPAPNPQPAPAPQLTGPPQPIPIASSYLPTVTYRLRTTAGRALYPYANKTANGTKIRTVNTDNNSNFQKFTLSRTKDGYYKLKNLASGRNLDVTDAGTKNGTKIQLWDNNDTCAQKWGIIHLHHGIYRLISSCSGRSLDINGNKIATSSVSVQLWDNNNTGAQSIVLESIATSPVSTDTPRHLVTTANKVLSPEPNNPNNSSALRLAEPTTTYYQQFLFSRQPDGAFTIKNRASGRNLDLKDANSANGTPVQLWDPNDTCAQRWFILSSNGRYRLTSACNGKSLDVDGIRVGTEGNKVQIWDSVDNDAQAWAFSPPPARPLPDGVYTLSSHVRSSAALSTASDSAQATNGTNIHLWDTSDTEAQKFQFIYSPTTGHYHLQHLQSEKLLDVSGARTTNGTNIQLWQPTGSCAQEWTIKPLNPTNPNTGYTLISTCSGRALDVTNAGFQNGTNLQLWDLNFTAAQKWQISPTVTTLPFIDDGVYNVSSSINSSYRLDVQDNSSAERTNLQLWGNNSTEAQKFRFIYDTVNGAYTIQHTQSNKVLTVANDSNANASNIRLESYRQSCGQHWYLNPTSPQHAAYTITSDCSASRRLDLSGAKIAHGTNIQTWETNYDPAQSWRLTPTVSTIPLVTNRLTPITSDLFPSHALAATQLPSSTPERPLIVNGSNIELHKSSSGVALYQYFLPAYDRSTGNYQILHLSGKYLDAFAAGTAPGTNVQLWDYASGCAQRWYINPTSAYHQAYTITSACSHLRLDFSSSPPSSITNLHLWPRTKTSSQHFIFAAPSPQ